MAKGGDKDKEKQGGQAPMNIIGLLQLSPGVNIVLYLQPNLAMTPKIKKGKKHSKGFN